jgi:hypothetical protein
MTAPNTHNVTATGTSTLEISRQYAHNVITVAGLAVGTFTVRAKEQSNTVFEDVVYGTIDLRNTRTIIIEDVQLKELEFTVTPEAAYTVKVKQYDSQP